MSIRRLKIGDKIICKPSVRGLVTDMKYLDPLTFKPISLGDRVTVSGPSGALIEMIVIKIADDNTLALGPLTEAPMTKPIGSSLSLVIAHQFRHTKSNFQAKQNDLVTVTDKNGGKVQMSVDLIVGKEFLLLTPPGNKKKIGIFDKLKFLWNVAGR